MMAEISLEPPAASTTIVVVLGASEYPRKPAWTNPVLAASARAFREYVISPDGLGIPDAQVLDLFDDDGDQVHQCLRIEEFLASAGQHAHDLLLYYVGHGSFDRDEYCLGIRATQRDREFITTIESRKLAQIIREGFARRRVFVILDACFSASAARDWQGDELVAAVHKMAGPLPKHGTAFLAAASKDDVTRAPRNERYTVFTGAVLQVLQQGTSSRRPKISLYEVYDEVRQLLVQRERAGAARPELHIPSQGEGDISRLPVFPNAAYSRVGGGRARRRCDTQGSRPFELSARGEARMIERKQVALRWHDAPTGISHEDTAGIVEPAADTDRHPAPAKKWYHADAAEALKHAWRTTTERLRALRARSPVIDLRKAPGAIRDVFLTPVSPVLLWSIVSMVIPFIGPIVVLVARHKLVQGHRHRKQLLVARALGLLGTIVTCLVIRNWIAAHSVPPR